MSTQSKKNRRDNEIDATLSKQSSEINRLDNEVKKLRKEYDQHVVEHIIEDLQKKRFYGSEKPLYTYVEIADKYNTSSATVTRIAEENNLSRRSKFNA